MDVIFNRKKRHLQLKLEISHTLLGRINCIAQLEISKPIQLLPYKLDL
jgi:hypothetical protein